MPWRPIGRALLYIWGTGITVKFVMQDLLGISSFFPWRLTVWGLLVLIGIAVSWHEHRERSAEGSVTDGDIGGHQDARP